jgi:hypothetical protein
VLSFHVTNNRFRVSIKRSKYGDILIKHSLNRTSGAFEVMISQRVCTIGGSSEGEKAISEIFVHMAVYIR